MTPTNADAPMTPPTIDWNPNISNDGEWRQSREACLHPRPRKESCSSSSAKSGSSSNRWQCQVLWGSFEEKGDVYDVDCAVTGSSPGTPSDPKCPLLPIFQNIIFPRIESMVGPGGKYEGYTPVFQGDNAGPHQDATYVNTVKQYCNDRGWYWEPQAPQMPHMNVLDLSVFPCHGVILRNVGRLAA